jgi:hypothetical protein
VAAGGLVPEEEAEFGGQLESELDLKAIEKLLGTDTRRTMGTLEQIAAKLG